MNAITHLQRDKKLKPLIRSLPEVKLKKRKHIHLEMCASIISQQLSIKVAEVINNRFLNLFSTKYPTPDDILKIKTETLRGIGLSNAKAAYLHNVCEFFKTHGVTDASLNKMDDETLIDFLVQIKGIGRWTAEMILIFSMGREDVFAVDDLGIQLSMADLYQLETKPAKQFKEEMKTIAEKWRPYRTYACRYLWAWRNAK